MSKHLPEERIFTLIYEIRGHKVMLDSDLAEMYGVETRALKQAVRRNPDRFPDDFMFELSSSEWDQLKESLRSQNVTLEKILTSSSERFGSSVNCLKSKPINMTHVIDNQLIQLKS